MDEKNKNLLAGLAIIFGKEPDTEVCAEHDILYAGSLRSYTKEEKKQLEALGFHREKDIDRWGFFV